MTTTCTSCGATPIACENRRWLSGRPCCDHCDHNLNRSTVTGVVEDGNR